MKKINLILCLMTMAVLFTMTTSCSKQLSEKQKKEMLKSIRESLPIDIEGYDGAFTNVDFEGDDLVYSGAVSSELFDEIGSEEKLNSDEYLVNFISGNDSDDIFVEYNIGMKFVIINKNDSNSRKTIELSPDRARELREKLKSGELKKHSYLDKIKDVFEKIGSSSDANDAIENKNYVEGNNVYFEMTFKKINDELDPNSDDYKSLYDDLRESMIKSLQAYKSYKQQIIDEDVHHIIKCMNAKGATIITIDLSPQDIFPEEGE
ncbi:MAG: hypothetical protein LUC88_02985 [Prevotella sp.]|nr:hypothetical protein [Prevotella sp.]